jgi:hypothetical protein
MGTSLGSCTDRSRDLGDEGNFSRARFKIRFQEFVSRSKRMVEPDSTELNNMRYITMSESL